MKKPEANADIYELFDWSDSRLDEVRRRHHGKSVRVVNCLEKAGIKKIEDLIRQSPSDLVCLKGFGLGCLKFVTEVLNCHGLALRPETSDTSKIEFDDPKHLLTFHVVEDELADFVRKIVREELQKANSRVMSHDDQ